MEHRSDGEHGVRAEQDMVRAKQEGAREEIPRWMAVDEGYWQALLEQGESIPEPVPPADAHDSFHPLVLEAENEAADLPTEVDDNHEGRAKQDWRLAQEAMERGELFRSQVLGSNRGGLLVEWNGMQGFVPASHLSEMPHTRDPQDRTSELARRIGEILTVRLIEVDEAQKRLVFSERTALTETESSSALLSTLHPGDVCQGTVINLTSFGAFVDLGGVEGLIHISEISWDRLHHPSEMLHPGERVEVQVLGVNPDEGRIALSMKRLRPNPWNEAEARYQVGQVVEGTITNVVSFGAFVRLEEGLEGLIHVSELADGRFMHPRNVVGEGDLVVVRVLNIDPSKRRLGLSLRRTGA